MTDLEELRRALRARESLAPDPGDVLTVATRRIRRRRTVSVAAVTLTVAALGAGTFALLDRGTPVEQGSPVTPASSLSTGPAGPPAGAEVPPPAPAVSLQDSSWQLAMWAVQPQFASLHYGQDHKYAFEIEVRESAAPKSALAAKPSAAGQIAQPQSVMWRDGPGRWIWARTTKPVTAAEMLALLGKIGTTPPSIASPLKSVHVPDGLKVVTFTSEPQANTLVLCPDAVAARAPLDSRCFSMFVSPSSRAADSVSPGDPLPLHQHRTLGAYTIELDSSPAGEQAALELLNSVQLNR
ncbi:hypothetical protein ACFVYA_43265 [Amycolatopsis sp. NPDC058278]|uniref:hypothetical protein n=1 Tax=Amycolatopsis sp. NPDC058278 TaxID=3346417 RepID=UPI0036DE0230